MAVGLALSLVAPWAPAATAGGVKVRFTGGAEAKFKNLEAVLEALEKTLEDKSAWGDRWSEKVQYSGRLTDYTFKQIAPELARYLREGTLEIEFRENKPTILGTAAAQSVSTTKIILFPASGRRADKALYSDYHLARTIFHELMHIWQRHTFTSAGLWMETEAFPTAWEKKLPTTHLSTTESKDPQGVTPVPVPPERAAEPSPDPWVRVQRRLIGDLTKLKLHARNKKRPFDKRLDGTFWFDDDNGSVTVTFPVWKKVPGKPGTPYKLEQDGTRPRKLNIGSGAFRTTELTGGKNTYESLIVDVERRLRRQYEKNGQRSGGRTIDGDRFVNKYVNTPYVVRAKDVKFGVYTGKLFTVAPTGRSYVWSAVYVSYQRGQERQDAIKDWDYRTTPDRIVAGLTFQAPSGKRFLVKYDTHKQAYRVSDIPVAAEADVTRIMEHVAKLIREEFARSPGGPAR